VTVVAAALVLALAGSAVAYRVGRSSNDRQVTAVTRVTDGTTEVQVPFGLVGKPFSDAQRTLTKLGFEIGATYEFSPQVAKDSVIEVSPNEGSFRERGGRVSVTVSKGRGDPVKVPAGLVGATYDQARKALIDADFAVNPSKSFSCDAVPAGKVESVNPPEGSEQQRGATVNVYVC
jgi:beta-lactam-binding protein with PASTA domain